MPHVIRPSAAMLASPSLISGSSRIPTAAAAACRSPPAPAPSLFYFKPFHLRRPFCRPPLTARVAAWKERGVINFGRDRNLVGRATKQWPTIQAVVESRGRFGPVGQRSRRPQSRTAQQMGWFRQRGEPDEEDRIQQGCSFRQSAGLRRGAAAPGRLRAWQDDSARTSCHRRPSVRLWIRQRSGQAYAHSLRLAPRTRASQLSGSRQPPAPARPTPRSSTRSSTCAIESASDRLSPSIE